MQWEIFPPAWRPQVSWGVRSLISILMPMLPSASNREAFWSWRLVRPFAFGLGLVPVYVLLAGLVGRWLRVSYPSFASGMLPLIIVAIWYGPHVRLRTAALLCAASWLTFLLVLAIAHARH